MLETIFVLLIGLAVVFIFFGRRKTFVQPETAPSDHRTYRHFVVAPSLFVNRAEMVFFHALQRVIPQDYYVMSKVRLEDIVGVKLSVKSPETRWKLRARVKSRHVDFLIVDKTGGPKVVIELDGGSHNADSFNADTLKNGLFRTTGLNFVRVPAGSDYSAQCQMILKLLNT